MTVTIKTNQGATQEYKNVDHITTTQSTTTLSSRDKTIATIYSDTIKTMQVSQEKCVNFRKKI